MTDTPQMRAIVAPAPGEPDVLELREVPRPTPSAGEVLIRVAAAGVNPVDAKTRRGKGATPFLGQARDSAGPPRSAGDIAGTSPTASASGAQAGTRGPAADGAGDAAVPAGFPWIPGWDLAGTVEEVGYGVARFAVGDRVFGTVGFPRPAGAYAEYAVAHVSQLSRSPRSLSDVDAAALAMGGLTSWQALVDGAGLETNQRVLITAAAGGVGHLAVQIAADLGAHVVAVGSPANLGFLRGLGAQETVDRTAEEWTAGLEPFDVVLDGIGGDAQAALLPLVRPGGAIVTLPSASWPDPADLPDGVRAPQVFVAPDGLELQLLTGSVERGALRPHVSTVLPLEQATRAHQLIESGGTRGKIVLTVGDQG